MNKSIFLIFLLMFLALPGCSESGPTLSISNLQVVASAPAQKPGVAYMAIHNQGHSDVVLVAVSSPQFARIEMHQTVLKDGVARMQSLASVTIEANSNVNFAPGGRHMMLFEPTQGLIPGAEISLQFEFESGEMLMVTSKLATRISVD
jgi:copper(I)-binding protein